jgi:hypothetical protein
VTAAGKDIELISVVAAIVPRLDLNSNRLLPDIEVDPLAPLNPGEQQLSQPREDIVFPTVANLLHVEADHRFFDDALQMAKIDC